MWNIEVEAGRTVELTFIDFDMEGHGTCGYDSVKVSYLSHITSL